MINRVIRKDESVRINISRPSPPPSRKKNEERGMVGRKEGRKKFPRTEGERDRERKEEISQN